MICLVSVSDNNSQKLEVLLKTVKGLETTLQKLVSKDIQKIARNTNESKNEGSKLFGRIEKSLVTKNKDITTSLCGVAEKLVSLDEAVNDLKQSEDEMKDQIKRSTNISVFSFTKLKQELNELKKPYVPAVITLTLWIVVFLAMYDMNRCVINQALTSSTLVEKLNAGKFDTTQGALYAKMGIALDDITRRLNS